MNQFLRGLAVLLLAALLCAFYIGRATAAPLAVVCTLTEPAGGTDPNTCIAGVYKLPVAGDLVRVGDGWPYAGAPAGYRPFVLRDYATVGATETLDACTTEGVVSGQALPRPWTAAADPCKAWGLVSPSVFVTAPQGRPAELKVAWTLPTAATDGSPLVGDQALTAVRLYVSTSPIADDSTLAPVATFAGDLVEATFSGSIPNGATVYVRVKAVNAGGASEFSAQASKVVTAPVVRPGVPTDVTVTFRVLP